LFDETEARRRAMKQRLSFVAALGLYFFASNPIAHAQQRPVTAESGGIAIGGNVSNSVIHDPPEEIERIVRLRTQPLEALTETQRQLIARLQTDLDLNQRQIRAALDILGERNVAPERLGATLVEIAERFKALRASASTQPGEDVQKAIDAGNLAKADALLADVETEQRHNFDHLAVSVADTSARRGEIALTRLRYTEAARHFADAAGVFPPGSAYEDKRIDYLKREAAALARQGDEFGDISAQRSAIERYKRLLDLLSRERVPIEWAAIQNDLGNALSTLGAHESDTTHLEEAVAAFRAALKELTRQRADPNIWIIRQSNLGNALFILGERESDTTHLEEAAAFRAALTEQFRKSLPSFWAATQNNLGNALQALGGRERERERESGTARLEEAVAAFRDALKEYTRERVPLGWAAAQNNLGNALWHLGWAQSSTERLEEAVTAYRDALKIRTRERLPLGWAMTQNNLGNALRDIGEHESGTVRLDEAVTAYSDALKEYTRDRVPLEWAMSTGNQGVALRLLAERRGDLAIAERALAQITEAFETFREAHHEPFATYYETQQRAGRALVEHLRKG
jgi:tetratricopeptide (TPR) repeat protein